MAIISTDILAARSILEQGQLVAIPTETVYGLAGNAFNLDAIANIFATKNRPAFDPLIVHAASREAIEQLVERFPPKAQLLADEFWPGPLTLLLKRKSMIPDLVTSGLDTVAVRFPNQPLTLELLATLDFPLVAPSANPFGYVSPTTAEHVNDQLGDKIPFILDGGACGIGIESTIVGFEGDQAIIHRLGGIGVEEIESVIGKVIVKIHSSSNPAAPGMLENHYSPLTKIILGQIEPLLKMHQHEKVGLLSYANDYGHAVQQILAPDQKTTTAAKNLFAALRWLDKQNLDLIIAELAPEHGLGLAINDRLKRAAAKKTSHQ